MAPETRGLYIDGNAGPSSSGKSFTTFDPSTHEAIAQVAFGGEADVDRAVTSASEAFGGWAATPPIERGRIMTRIATALRDGRERLGAIESSDTGKPRWLSVAEVASSARYFELYAGLAESFAGETIPLGPGYVSYTRREPYGVIAEILPWNLPLNQAARAVAPALVTGNTVVVKPAEITPLTALELATIATDAGLPPGVLNVVTGPGSVVGEALVRHPLVRKVGFTGSVETGRRIAGAAGDRLIPTSLELGGKSANIVFEDAHLDAAVAGAFQAFTHNVGQVCSAGARLLVHEGVHDHVVERLSRLADEVTIGPAADDQMLGPMVSRGQVEVVRGYLELARREGATLIPADGEVPATESYVRPTILVDVSNDMRVVREEIFGPVLSVLRFRTEQEAIAIANDSPFGLVAGLWTRDLARAHRVAALLEVGQVFVNEWFAGGEAAPFGGVKESGYGRLKGREALYHYTQVKTVTVKL